MNLRLVCRPLWRLGAVLLDEADKSQFDSEGNPAVADAELKSSVGGVGRADIEENYARLLSSLWSSAIFLSFFFRFLVFF